MTNGFITIPYDCVRLLYIGLNTELNVTCYGARDLYPKLQTSTCCRFTSMAVEIITVRKRNGVDFYAGHLLS